MSYQAVTESCVFHRVTHTKKKNLKQKFLKTYTLQKQIQTDFGAGGLGVSAGICSDVAF